MRYTDAELEELGVRRVSAPGRGFDESDAYIFKCAKCGRPTLRHALILSRPVYCTLCKNDAREKKKACKRLVEKDAKELEQLMGIDPKSEDRFSKAIKTVSAIGNYEKAIEKASAYKSKYGSVPEVIAAIILASCGVDFVPQAKIFENKRSSVDFLLPHHKTVIEVDGILYHADAEKRVLRDISIRQVLGSDWSVIHLPAEDLTKRTKTVKRLLSQRFQ